MRRLRLHLAGLLALLSLVVLASFVAHAEERALAFELISLNGATPQTHPPAPSRQVRDDATADPGEGQITVSDGMRRPPLHAVS